MHACSFALPRNAGWLFRLEKRMFVNLCLGGSECQSSRPELASQARNAPSCKKYQDSGSEQTWIWSERTRRKKVDKQQPHTDELSESAGVEQRSPHTRSDRSSFRFRGVSAAASPDGHAGRRLSRRSHAAPRGCAPSSRMSAGSSL